MVLRKAPRRARRDREAPDIAKGASSWSHNDVNFLTGAMRYSSPVADVMWRNLQKVGPPQFDEADLNCRVSALTFDEAENMLKPDFASFRHQEAACHRSHSAQG